MNKTENENPQKQTTSPKPQENPKKPNKKQTKTKSHPKKIIFSLQNKLLLQKSLSVKQIEHFCKCLQNRNNIINNK